MTAPPTLRDLYELLDEHVVTGDWWPGETRYEIVVGALLVQNTAWANVARAIEGIRAETGLDPSRVLALPEDRLQELVRPSGSFTRKTQYLRVVTSWFLQHDERAQTTPTADLRAELLRLSGVGEETADAILLYVYDRGQFVYDAYARRLIAAAGLGEYRSYGAARAALQPQVDAACFSVEELARFHGLIVDAGKLARRLGGWERAYPLLRDGAVTVAAWS